MSPIPKKNKSDEIANLRSRLAESEARFKALTETFPIAVGISNSDGSFLYINKAYYHLFGYTLEEINQIKSTDLYVDQKDRLSWLGVLQQGGDLKDHEVQLKRKDGTLFWAEISVLPIDLTGRQAYIGSVVDITERKRLEAERKEIETRRTVTEATQAERRRFFDVLETLPVMVCLLTQDYHVAFANRAFRNTFGEANGKHCYEYCFGLSEPCEFCESYIPLTTGRPHHWEITTEQGIVIDAYDNPFTDVDGSPMVLEMDVDITERRKAEQELARYHQQLEAMVHERTASLEAANTRLAYLASFPEINPRPIVEVSLDGKINYVNPMAQRLFPDIVKTGLAHPWFINWDNLVNGFAQNQGPVTMRDIQVEGRIYQQTLNYLEEQGLVRIYGLDITEQKKAEQALHLSEERYRTIVETAAEGIVLAKPSGEYVYVNRQMANMLGYPVEEILGKTGFDFMYDPQLSQVKQARDMLHKGEVLRGEFKFRRKDGTILWSMYNASPIFNDQGEHVANISMLTDITDRKDAEQALHQAHDQLELRVQERTQELFSANNQLRAEVAEREKTQTELELSVQELQVIEEELRNNNEMLMDAQKVLETERQRYRDLFEFAPDAYLVTDKNGRVIEANQNTTTLLGIDLRHLIRKPLVVFIHPADHQAFYNLLGSLRNHESMPPQEFKLQPRQGPEILASVKVAVAEGQGRAYSLRWTIRDITARKLAEENIRQNALRNAVLSEVSQSLTEASLDEKAILEIVVKTTARLVGDSCVITLASVDGKRLEPTAWHHKNPEAVALMNDIYGTTPESIVTEPLWRVFQDVKPLLTKGPPLAEGQGSISPQSQKYQDSIGISSILIVPIQSEGKVIGTLGITRDREGQPYTEDDQAMLQNLATRTGQSIHNARLYQELQVSLRKELETHDQLVQAEKFAAVGRLLASITHEINNPLQTIKNCLYLSQLDTPPGTPASDALNIATAETNRLSNLVAQLREIYRPPTQGTSKPVDLPSLVDEVQVLLVSYMQDKKVRWKIIPPTDERFSHLLVEGVPDQLKQVFLNISLNAIDAMEPQGGTLNIDFKVNAEADRVGIRFQDTGPGLPDEVKVKLFEPFTTTKEKGLGLGLVICYDIVQKHNGQIEVESTPGKGAAFTIWLPAKREIA